MDGRRARIVLGVGNDAGPEEIRRAFRARAEMRKILARITQDKYL